MTACAPLRRMALLAMGAFGFLSALAASPASAQTLSLRGRSSCAAGSEGCNALAQDLLGQLDFMNHSLDFSRYPFHIPSNMWGPFVDDDDGANGNTAHPQGLVQTNKVGGKWFYAISYNEKEGNGSISFVTRRSNGEKWVDYIFERPVEHPSSLAQIGKYVMWVERERLYVMDTTKLAVYAGRNPPAVIRPDGYAKAVPYIRDSQGRIGTGGGGIGITQLSNGDYLLAAGLAGGDASGVQVRLHILRGSLATPESITFQQIADLDFGCDSTKTSCSFNQNSKVMHARFSNGNAIMPGRDENLSLVSDTAGRIFLYLPDRVGSGGDRFYWYQLTASSTAMPNHLITARATHAVSAKSASCWYQGGTSARVDTDGVLQLLCGANDFDRSDRSDLRMYFWMHPCVGNYRSFGDPNQLCSTP